LKHGFVLAFYSLLKSADVPEDDLYDFIMRQIVALGGDTDTNAAIAGGMIGAYLGISKLPQEKVKKILECDTTEKTKKTRRPEFCTPSDDAIQLITELIQVSPT